MKVAKKDTDNWQERIHIVLFLLKVSAARNLSKSFDEDALKHIRTALYSV